LKEEQFVGETGKFLGFALVVWRKWRIFADNHLTQLSQVEWKGS
jgi:hypothetical protein